MNSYLQLLNKIYSSKKPVKSIKPDDLTSSLCPMLKYSDYSEELCVGDFLQQIETNTLRINEDFVLDVDLNNISYNSNDINSFLNALEQTNVSKNSIYLLKTFVERYSCENKPVLSVVWAGIVNNSINKDTELNNELIQLFLAVADADKDASEASILALQNQVVDIFSKSNLQSVKDYFDLVFNKNIKDGEWYNFDGDSFIPESFDFQSKDVVINNEKELLDAISNIETFGSALAYIKENYLKKEKNETISDYKAFYIILKILSDKNFTQLYPNFKIGNSYGFNIDKDLDALEKAIRTEDSDIKPNTMVGFQQEAKEVAKRILGKEKKNEYLVWNNAIKLFMKRCDSLSEKVMMRKLSDSDRKYLIGMKLLREREVIQDYDNLYIAIRMLADQASSLSRKHLNTIKVNKNKGIEPLKHDKSIKDAEQFYNELTSWLEFVKTLEPKYSFKSPKDLKTDELGFAPKLQLVAKVAKKEFSPSIVKKQKQSSGEQLNLYEEVDNLENE